MVSRGQKELVDFCGMVQVKEQIFLFFPKTTSSSSFAESVLRFRMLLKVLKKYTQNVPDVSESAAGGLIGKDGNFDVSLRILEDWERYGIYKPEHKENEIRDTGKINWGKTLRSIEPIYLKEGMFYPKFHRTRSNSNDENFIRKLHKTVAVQCFRKFGWLRERPNPDLANLNGILVNFSHSLAIKALTVERSKTRSDRNRCLFDMLEAYLKSDRNMSSNLTSVFGLRSFWRVWEEICSEVLGNEIGEISALLPQPEYKKPLDYPEGSTFGAIGSQKLNQRPDIVLVSPDVVAVLDAKYYDTNNSMPSWPDLVKQFLYANTLKSVLTKKGYGNILLFPANHTLIPDTLKKAPLVTLYSGRDQEKKELSEFGKIYCLCCSLDDFMTRYIYGTPSNELRMRILELIREDAVHVEPKNIKKVA